MSFEAEVAAGTLEILEEAGVLGTYFPQSGDPVPDVAVIIDRDVAPAQAGQPTTTVERRTELTAAHSVLGLARRDETVEVGSETWRLVTKDRDDGYLATWIVTLVLS